MSALSKLFQMLPPRLPGKQRLGRALLRLLKQSDVETVVPGLFGLRYTTPNLIENVAFEIFINGAVEIESIDFMVQKLKAYGENPRLLDIGANIGGIALPCASLVQGLQVYCIEASPRVFSYLKRNIEDNNLGDRVFADNLAISDSDASTLQFFSPNEQFGKGSLSAVFTKEGVSVPNQRLDAWVANTLKQQPNLIKIDVEGFERQIFDSGVALFTPNDAPDIYFEFIDWAEELAGNTPGAAQSALLKLGYKLYDPDRGMKSVTEPLKKGGAMLFATKN